MMSVSRRFWIAAKVLVLFITMVLFVMGSSYGQQGSTNLKIDVQSILVLHYFQNVSILLDSATLGGVYTSNSVAETDKEQQTGFDVTLGINGEGGAETSAATLTLREAWAVRSINADNTQVSITLGTATLTNTADSDATIEVSSPTVSISGGTAAATIDFPAPGMRNPQKGDVSLILDMTKATKEGSYDGAVFTITASNL